MSSLRTKLTVLLGLPLAVLVLVAGLGVLRASGDVADSRATSRAVELSVAAATAARHLSREADLSADAITGGPVTRPAGELESQRRETDETVEELESLVEEGGEAAKLHMKQALAGLGRLETTRQAVDQRQPGTPDVAGSYAEMAGPVLEVDRLLDRGRHPQIANRIDAHLALSRAIQTIAREEVLIASMLTAGVVDPATYDQVVGLGATQQLWLSEFEDTAATEDLESYSEAAASPATETAARFRQNTLSNGPGGPTIGDAATWSRLVGRRLDLLEPIADETGAELTATARAQQAAAEGRRTSALLVFLGALALAAAALGALHRFVIRPLRRLATASRAAVEETVPTAIEVAESDGTQVALAAVPPVPVASSEELAQVARAFNALQEKAIRLASESPRPDDVNAVFLKFGRRTQDLVTNQLTHIDSLESRTDNPDTLADLFLLDHLATRLRRNAESLVVLAGADTPRPWARPVTVVNVIRAAVAEAADYSRVDIIPIAPGPAVVGACANDVSHLLAELIDNALAFSTREARVVVTGDAQADGRFLVAVSDAGMGMTPAQLAEANARIATTPLSDVGATRYFGLYVVGRLAQRHDISVRLTPSLAGGVTAEVLLPRALIAEAATRHDPPALASAY